MVCSATHGIPGQPFPALGSWVSQATRQAIASTALGTRQLHRTGT